MWNAKRLFQLTAAAALFIALAVFAATRQTNDDFTQRGEGMLNVVGHIPLDGRLLKDQIVFFFDAALAGLPPQPGEKAPLSFDPLLEGEYEYGPNRIVFYPRSVPNQTEFHITLNPNLKSVNGAPLNPKQTQYVFSNTAFFAERFWTIEDNDEGRVDFGLLFTLPPSVKSVREHLIVKAANGNIVSASVERTGEKTLRVSIPGDVQFPVSVTLSEETLNETGQYHLTIKGEWKYPQDAELQVTQLNWIDVNPDEQRIAINFNTQVNADDLSKNLTVTNGATNEELESEITSEGWRDSHEVLIHAPDPGDIQVRVNIDQALTGRRHTQLARSYHGTLRNRAQSLALAYNYWNFRGEEGQSLYLRFNQPVFQDTKIEDWKPFITIDPELPNMELAGNDPYSIEIMGDWREQQQYYVTIEKNAPTSASATLDNPLRFSVTVDQTPEWLGFGYDSDYFIPRQANAGLPLLSRHTQSASVQLYRLFPNNAAVALDAFNNGQGGDYFNSRWCELITDKKVTLPGGPGLHKTLLALDDYVPSDRRGVFCMQASGENYSQASKIIIYTDMGLLAHWTQHELAVFVHDLASLSPLANAKVTLYSDKNQVLAEGRSDREGIVFLSDWKQGLGQPRLVVAENAQDYAILELSDRQEGAEAIDSNLAHYDSGAYDAFLYADRELYRPGETAHLRWIVKKQNGEPVANIPLQLVIQKPNGNELSRQAVTLSDLGTGGLDFESQGSYPTGRYTAQLIVPGGAAPIGTYVFSLEEFVPNRIKADVSVSESPWIAGREYNVAVKAEHLFGAPASDRKCEAVIYFQRGFKSVRWSDFHFDNDSTYTPESYSLGEAKSDETGSATFTYTYTPDAKTTFPLRASVVGRVYEMGGRPVQNSRSVSVLPAGVMLGVNVSSDVPDSINVKAAAIQPDESPASLDSVLITLEKQTWSYYIRRFYGTNEPNWTPEYSEIQTIEAPLKDGVGEASFHIDHYGYYRVRVHSPETQQFCTQSFYSYGRGLQKSDSAQPRLIQIKADQPKYQPGDTAVIRLESPFDGQGFVIVQGETIREVMPVSIQNGTAEFQLNLTEDDAPNLWIEATIAHSLDQARERTYPYSSFAMTSIAIKDPARRLDVSFIDPPEEIRPETEVSLTLETRDADQNPVPAELTLAAVDEGVHLITNYASPDPYAWFMRPRQPEFHRAHYYDRIVLNAEKSSPSGGMSERALALRASSDLENWIKPVALWSGVVRTDESGRATISMKPPKFNGRLRLVAVAASANASGATDRELFVRQPYMLRASLPRFLSSEDAARCRAVVFNQSDAPIRAVLKWETSGALQTASGESTLDVPAHAERNAIIEIQAGRNSGEGAIEWTLIAKNENGEELERYSERMALPVQPSAAYQSKYTLRVLNAGESMKVDSTGFTASDDFESTIELGANPALQLKEALGYVIGYPYGCVEQTTSRLMPLYLLRKNEDLLASAYKEAIPLQQYIQAGIDRLFAMQTGSGGLGYWPGATEPNQYGSVYALHFLTLVEKDREFQLPAHNLQALKDYVRGLANDWTDDSMTSRYQRAYALFVLAWGGDLDAIKQIPRFDSIVLPRAARYMLGAALAVNTQDMARVTSYLQNTPSEPFDAVEQGGVLNSPIRNEAVELLALETMKGDAQRRAELAQNLIAYLKSNHYGNTQETAFIITALSEFLKGIVSDASSASARIERSDGVNEELRGEHVYKQTLHGPGAAFTITNTGQVDLYVNAVARGVPTSVSKEAESHGIRLARDLYSAQWEPADRGEFNQGDGYIIDLIIQCDAASENVVIVDKLAAGFEVENPRLDADALPRAENEDRPGAAAPSYMDIRDDRVVLAFDRLEQGVHHFYYAVRAVTPGRYQMPPSQAECMYDARVNGRTAMGEIEIN
ncbi:MAG: hypothetical protein GC154_09570 [bacterium]|nr:hypothetical protein [bacterium]